MANKKQNMEKFPNLPGNVPVTQKMLFGVRNELVSKFMSLEHKVESFRQEVKSDVHEIKGEVHRIALLVEEQNSKNNIVLDGLANLFSRQERIEQQLAHS